MGIGSRAGPGLCHGPWQGQKGNRNNNATQFISCWLQIEKMFVISNTWRPAADGELQQVEACSRWKSATMLFRRRWKPATYYTYIYTYIYIYIYTLRDDRSFRISCFRKRPPSHISDNAFEFRRPLAPNIIAIASHFASMSMRLSRWELQDEGFKMILSR